MPAKWNFIQLLIALTYINFSASCGGVVQYQSTSIRSDDYYLLT